ncbi:TIGR02281 family clan AA aspartic protease [Xanthobacter tagetidis]|jgi:aspartyl protease family protein|uniref:TIGR02281 family clan AA aspartic protease n=1 Tax=Xanthobacter tagetidis TaxID=60216 RepID=A0A3L7AIR5_9HYPH|nr:TIGR02281 family clan AA aspartic protease [Xanthobacter tagetidis]MBB6309132.1 aspartyl protease family protein [Xanthobacter tagetidis]RLP80386.1 TIGR02281 family clan AA aspartic protease [Xanthobacter tagetidis]
MRGDRLLWLLLLGLFGGVVVLAVHHEQGSVAGLDLDQFGSLVAKLSIAIFIGAFAWSMFRGRVAESLIAAAFWVVLAAVLAVAYTYRDPLQAVAQRVIGQLVPGYVVPRLEGARVTVEVTRGAAGDFAVRASVNGAGVPMLVDTGATSVVLTHAAAQAAGLPVEFLTYDVAVETANGRTKAAAVNIDNIIVGGIVERQVPALVSPPGVLRTSLLGMTFLSRLDGFEFRGDRLTMRGPKAP